MADTRTYVLIHGAWHGAWCWERLAPLLRERGHRVLAPDLPGRGGDTTPLDKLSLSRCARFLSELLAEQAEPVVLVGHSMGGMVISQAAGQVPAKVRCLVYLAAFLPREGDSVFGLMEEAAACGRHGQGTPPIADAMRFSSDRRRCHLDPWQASALLYPGCRREDADRARHRLGQEATLLLSGKARLGKDFARIAKVYLPTRQDQVIPLDQQRRMADRQACRQLPPLNADHSPFLSMPAALADRLQTL